MSDPLTIEILSAVWERDHENSNTRLQHGAYIWHHNQNGWGFRGKSNPFPRWSWFSDDYLALALSGYREGFYQMSSTLNSYNHK